MPKVGWNIVFFRTTLTQWIRRNALTVTTSGRRTSTHKHDAMDARVETHLLFVSKFANTSLQNAQLPQLGTPKSKLCTSKAPQLVILGHPFFWFLAFLAVLHTVEDKTKQNTLSTRCFGMTGQESSPNTHEINIKQIKTQYHWFTGGVVFQTHLRDQSAGYVREMFFLIFASQPIRR